MPRQLTLPRGGASSLSVPRKFRSRRTVGRLLGFVLFVCVAQSFFGSSKDPADVIKESHPIASRLDIAAARWRKKVAGQSKTWEEFVPEYVRRYKMDPPEGMERWFRVAKEDGHLLVDEYDEMMRSLEPFRALGGEEVLARTLEIAKLPTFSLLNVTLHHSYFYGQDYRGSGQLVSRDDYGPGMERVEGLAAMLQRHINHVPDGTIFAVSELAEPRVIVPWQDHLNTLAQTLRHENASSASASSISIALGALKPPNISQILPTPNYQGDSQRTTWEMYAGSCPPGSPARKQVQSLRVESAAATRSHFDADAIGKPKSHLSSQKRRALQPEDSDSDDLIMAQTRHSPAKSFGSAEAVHDSNQFEFMDIGRTGLSHEELCSDPSLHQIQGAFYSDWRSIPALYPVFSPSTLPRFSVPSNFYYGDDRDYSLGESNTSIPWETKADKMVWRGKTTGGGNTPPGFQLQYQRHRFMQMAQSFSRAAQSLLVPTSRSSVLKHIKRAVGDLNSAWFDVGFTGFAGCGDTIPLKDFSKYKAILDLDGMAFSGRFVALMGMGSGVFKSTIYRDFASDWLEPWHHFVPLSAGYSEIYNLLAYFLPLPPNPLEPTQDPDLPQPFSSSNTQTEGDAALQSIAKAALEWSDLVANVPDIEAYVYRLALEWSRVLKTPAPSDVRAAIIIDEEE